MPDPSAPPLRALALDALARGFEDEISHAYAALMGSLLQDTLLASPKGPDAAVDRFGRAVTLAVDAYRLARPALEKL